MANVAVDAHGLRKAYGTTVAVADATFEVPRGSIFAFLGPNGSGKTTTLGMVTGLVRPDAGSVSVAGNLGAVVEGPAFYPGLSGRRNLRLLARLMERPRDAVDDALARAGIAQDADRKVGGYSLGMRQRLGLAGALLGQPEVLILDEPTNGLDPAGQQEVRVLLRGLAKTGHTILLSSHLLHDVEELCTHAAIIHHGRILKKGPMHELLATGEELVFSVSDLALASKVLAQALGPASIHAEGPQVVAKADERQAGALNRRLVEAGVDVSGLAVRRRGLEERFLELVGRDAK